MKYITPLLLVSLFTGCTTLLQPPSTTFNFDIPEKNLKIDIEYKAYHLPGTVDMRCAGKVTVQNYGKVNYQGVLMNLSFYDDSNTLTATDQFTLPNGLIAGGRVVLDASVYNYLDSPTTGKVFRRFPASATNGRINVNAY